MVQAQIANDIIKLEERTTNHEKVGTEECGRYIGEGGT